MRDNFLVSANSTSNGMRIVALIALFAGAIGTLVFLSMVSSHQHSIVLRALFIAWDTAPFLALLWFHRSSAAWPQSRLDTLNLVSAIVAVMALAMYGNAALGTTRLRPAAPFLIVPIGCWIVIAVGRSIARSRATR